MGSTISYYLSSYSMQQMTDYMNDYNKLHDENNTNNYIYNNYSQYYNNYYTKYYNNITYRLDFIKSVVKTSYQYYINNYSQYYTLYIYIDPSVSESTKEKYINSAKEHNSLVENYLNAINKYNNPNNSINMNDFCLNAGFDLFCPDNLISESSKQLIIDHKIICCMKYDYKYISYYLYSRSSTPIKTPLRLANSVGIIDSGYRGNIKAIFDNVDYLSSNNHFNVMQNNRYVQICPPNIEYPMKICIVDNIDDIGKNTIRGTNGFGSSDYK